MTPVRKSMRTSIYTQSLAAARLPCACVDNAEERKQMMRTTVGAGDGIRTSRSIIVMQRRPPQAFISS